MIALATAGIGLHASVAIDCRLGGGDWIPVAMLAVFVIGCVLGASALVQRPGVAVLGLLGGLVVALA